MSMPKTDDASARKRKRHVVEPQADKAQRCIDHFFVPRDSPDTRLGSPLTDQKGTSNTQDELAEHTKLTKTAVPAIMKRQALEEGSQTDPQQLTPKCSKDAHHQHPKRRSTGAGCSMEALGKQQAALSADGRPLMRTQSHFSRKAKASGSMGPDADAQQQLLRDLATFHTSLLERQQFREVDVAVRLSPTALIGRKLRIYWPEDDGWYLGTAVQYLPQSGQHKVKYDDGEEGILHLPVERVRLLMHAGESFTPATPAELESLAKGLLSSANGMAVLSPRTRKQCTSPGKEQAAIQEAEAGAAALRHRGVQLEKVAKQLRSNRAQALSAAARPAATAAPAATRPAATATDKSTSAVAGLDSAAGPPDTGEAAADRLAAHQKPAWVAGQPKMHGAQQAHDDLNSAAMQPAADPTLSAPHSAPGGSVVSATGAVRQAARLDQTLADQSQQALPETGAAPQPAQHDQVSDAQPSSAAPEQPAAVPKQPADADPQQRLPPDSGGGWQRGAPGLVVWGSVKGWPPWPGIVLTEEEMDVAGVQGKQGQILKVPGKAPGKVPVHYFGTQEFAWLKPSEVRSFEAGLEAGMHICKARNRSKPAFKKALHEVHVYFVEGELPSQMVPKHNDDPYSDDEEEEEATVGVPVPVPGSAAGFRFPLKLTSSLTVLALGKVEFLHPAYHNVKNFWPVGYRVARLASTPASGGLEKLHICEILAAPDGSGPIFRVTPKGCASVEGRTATKAWTALYDSQQSARALCFSGAKQFGLQHPRVQRMLQSLPEAAYCQFYAAWLGPAPPVPPLSEEQIQMRRAAEANMQRLPGGVQPQPNPQPAGLCHVCYTEDYTDDNLLLECDGCRVLVHMECYGVEQAPQGQSWLCDVCTLGPGLKCTPACALCPVMGPPLKRTSCSRFCHILCAQWLGETFIREGVVHGINNVSKAKHQLTCYLCQQRYGACIQCAGSNKCFQAFHPTCARAAGLVMETVQPNSDYETSEAESDSEAQPADSAAHQPAASLDENLDTSNMLQAASSIAKSSSHLLSVAKSDSRPGTAAAASAAPKRKRRRRTGPVQEGTYIGGGCRMMCYCPKHSHVTQLKTGVKLRPSSEASFGSHLMHSQRVVTEPRALSQASGTQAESACDPPGKGQQQQQQQQSLQHEAGCIRSVPYNHACRRGQREPDAIAAALAKRLFVRKTPYLIGSAQHCRASQLPVVKLHRSEQSLLEQQNIQGAQGQALGSAHVAVKTQTERFKEMQQTVGRRLTCGKSAIHGLGAFTKLPHQAEDMVIEYAGEMVRPSVADRREAASYNQLVGAGTYVFTLDDDYMVDATKAGNMAHVLNHSCNPNCYSKHVHVWNEGCNSKEHHVVICAKQTIGIGEELTYDYRFLGKERLPCNCGASTCRGFVNKAVNIDEEKVVVARFKLQPL